MACFVCVDFHDVDAAYWCAKADFINGETTINTVPKGVCLWRPDVQIWVAAAGCHSGGHALTRIQLIDVEVGIALG